MLQGLLQERRDSDVLSLVAKLVARNSELEQRLARAMSRTHKNEGVSEAQLKLFMDVLTTESDDEAGAAIRRSPTRTRSCATPLASTSPRRAKRNAASQAPATVAPTAASASAPHRQSDRGARADRRVPQVRGRARVHRPRRHRGDRARAGGGGGARGSTREACLRELRGRVGASTSGRQGGRCRAARLDARRGAAWWTSTTMVCRCTGKSSGSSGWG